VGTGPFESHLKSLVAQMGLAQQVTFQGFVPRPQLPEIYLSHDVLVAPSLYESGGLSILEAFSFGLPAIALKRGGPALSVSKNCGVLVEVDQPQEGICQDLRDAIMHYSNHRELLPTHGQHARERLRENYSWEIKRSTMQQAYQRVFQPNKEHG